MSDDRKLVMGRPQGANLTDGSYVAWLTRPAHELEKQNSIYFGVSGTGQHLSGSFTVDDAEAIGYSLLYAVKLQRDKEAGTDG